jgi:hypothetical protein
MLISSESGEGSGVLHSDFCNFSEGFKIKVLNRDYFKIKLKKNQSHLS